jgi:hypothetical protein
MLLQYEHYCESKALDSCTPDSAAHHRNVTVCASPFPGTPTTTLSVNPFQLWAQQLGTAQTVSDARIRKMLSP